MNDPRAQTHQTDMALGYEEDALPQTFEGLEQKFIQDIMTLTREQQNAEDGENARHREQRLTEINSQYQEKLLAVRARQATHREDFLRKESQARHEQYQQVKLNSYQSSAGPNDAHGFRMATAAALGDPPRAYGASSFDSYGERPGFGGGAQGRGYESHESHGQYPGGRAYNTGGRYF
ncbi:uncharacterized protein M6B38_254535 [Iris pallida]|uniref:Uncharacterized protein n=1 Tax=Iris pallida TaxID=29817 RepID=A0AAX6IG22_IRIPA|nr:uncharacterized protein M6B38_254535 [Iris pallida]